MKKLLYVIGLLKILNKYYFVVGFIFSIGLFYFFLNKNLNIKANTINYIFENVVIGNISNSINVLGKVELAEEQALRFSKNGQIVKVNYFQGDMVQKGSIIAELDKTAVNLQVEQQKLNLENAKLKLQSLYQIDESKLLEAQKNINNTKESIDVNKKEFVILKSDLDNNILNLEKDIDFKQKEIDVAKKALLNLQNNISINETEYNLLDKEVQNSIINIENDINFKQKEVDNAKIILSDLEKSHQILIENQSKDLLNTQTELSNNYTNLILNFEKDLIQAQETIESLDLIIGVTDKNANKNDDYEIYLSARNSNNKTQAEYYLKNSIKLYEQNELIDKNNYLQYVDYLINLFENVYLACDFTYKSLDNTIASYSFTENDISTKKNSISGLRSKIQSYQSTFLTYKKQLESMINIETYKQEQHLIFNKSIINIDNQKNNIEKLEFQLNNLIKDLEKLYDENQIKIYNKKNSNSTVIDDLENQKNNIDKLISQLNNLQNDLKKNKEENEIKIQVKQNTINNLEKTLEIQEKTYKELIEGPTKENIISNQNDVKKAELSLADSLKELDNYNLIAPFSGLIRKIDFQTGDNITNDISKYVYIENPNFVQIPILLDQIDIVKVKIGQKAKIKFDAYPQEVVEGEISLIDYTPVEQSGVIFYTIMVIITDDNFTKQILSGMTAEVEIVIESKNGVKLVSSQSVQTRGGNVFLRMLNGGIIENISIQTGLSSGGKTEIIGDIQEGTRIIQSEIVKTNSSTQSTTNSLFPVGGGNMGRGTSNNQNNRQFNR